MIGAGEVQPSAPPHFSRLSPDSQMVPQQLQIALGASSFLPSFKMCPSYIYSPGALIFSVQKVNRVPLILPIPSYRGDFIFAAGAGFQEGGSHPEAIPVRQNF